MAGKDVYAGRLFLASFFGTAIVLVIVLVMMVLYYGAERRLLDERVLRAPYADTERALLDQRARLEEYQRMADVEEFGETRAAYRIPIDEAVQRVLADWESGALPGKTVAADLSAPPAAEEAGPGDKPNATPENP